MAQYTFPDDLSEFIDLAEILETAYPVGIVIVLDADLDPAADLGLPGTWEDA